MSRFVFKVSPLISLNRNSEESYKLKCFNEKLSVKVAPTHSSLMGLIIISCLICNLVGPVYGLITRYNEYLNSWLIIQSSCQCVFQ